MLDVVLDCIWREHELLRHLTAGVTARHHSQHLHFTFAEAGWALTPDARHAMASFGQDSIDRIAIRTPALRARPLAHVERPVADTAELQALPSSNCG